MEKTEVSSEIYAGLERSEITMVTGEYPVAFIQETGRYYTIVDFQ